MEVVLSDPTSQMLLCPPQPKTRKTSIIVQVGVIMVPTMMRGETQEVMPTYGVTSSPTMVTHQLVGAMVRPRAGCLAATVRRHSHPGHRQVWTCLVSNSGLGRITSTTGTQPLTSTRFGKEFRSWTKTPPLIRILPQTVAWRRSTCPTCAA